MKKIFVILALIGIILLVVFIKDPGARQSETLASIYDNVIAKDAQTAVQSCKDWQQTLSTVKPGVRPQSVDQAFEKLILAWKAVEAAYIAGDLDAAAIDYPRFIDIFHSGNEDINRQMAKVLASDSKPQIALYKNSYKTVNALESVLYADNDLTARELAIAGAISDNICKRLAAIDTVYREQRDAFVQDPGKALSLLANALASNTFKTKDWRIGDPAGLTNKYSGRADAGRSEYAKSGLSMPAIIAILGTQQRLIDEQPYANFRDLVAYYGAEQQLQSSSDLLDQAYQAAVALNKAGFDFNPQATKALYQVTGELQTSYYNNLIQALPVMAKILEADGD